MIKWVEEEGDGLTHFMERLGLTLLAMERPKWSSTEPRSMLAIVEGGANSWLCGGWVALVIGCTLTRK